MAGALREFVMGGGNVCDAGAGASSSTGRFASQFLAGKGYESAAQGQQQGVAGSAPLPFAMGHQPFNPMSEAERIGNAPSMAPGGMQLQTRLVYSVLLFFFLFLFLPNSNGCLTWSCSCCCLFVFLLLLVS